VQHLFPVYWIFFPSVFQLWNGQPLWTGDR
jgi:hypothetical protein